MKSSSDMEQQVKSGIAAAVAEVTAATGDRGLDGQRLSARLELVALCAYKSVRCDTDEESEEWLALKQELHVPSKEDFSERVVRDGVWFCVGVLTTLLLTGALR